MNRQTKNVVPLQVLIIRSTLAAKNPTRFRRAVEFILSRASQHHLEEPQERKAKGIVEEGGDVD